MVGANCKVVLIACLLPAICRADFVQDARAYVNGLDHAPRADDWVEFASLHSKAASGLERATILQALHVFLTAEEPLANKDELVVFTQSYRKSLSSFECAYTIDFTNQQGVSQYGCLFIRNADRHCRFKRSLRSGLPIKLDVDVSYDGDVARSYQQGTNGAFAASVDPSLPKPAFVDLDFNVMVNAMQADLQDFLGITSPEYDLLEFLKQDMVFVFGGIDSINQYECICVSSFDIDVWLSIDMGFVPVLVKKFQTEAAGRSLIREVEMTGFAEFSEGLFFPQRISVSDVGKENAPSAQFRIETLRVNQSIDPKLFKNIFPRRAIVRDRVKDLTYFANDDGSIAETIDLHLLAAKSKSIKVHSGSFVSKKFVIANAIVVLIAATFWLSKAVARKRAA